MGLITTPVNYNEPKTRKSTHKRRHKLPVTFTLCTKLNEEVSRLERWGRDGGDEPETQSGVVENTPNKGIEEGTQKNRKIRWEELRRFHRKDWVSSRV